MARSRTGRLWPCSRGGSPLPRRRRPLRWLYRSSRSHRFFSDLTCTEVRLRGSNGGSGNAETPAEGFPVANRSGACTLTQVVKPDSDARWLLTVAGANLSARSRCQSTTSRRPTVKIRSCPYRSTQKARNRSRCRSILAATCGDRTPSTTRVL